MYRKILAICAALAALAVVPSQVSATTLKAVSGGVETTVATGSKFVAESEETLGFTSGLGTVSCNENILTGSVDKNDSKEFQLTIEDAWFQSKLTTEGTKCHGTGFIGNTTVTIPGLTNGSVKNTHWCIRSIPGTDNWELWGNNCTTEPGTGALTFVLEDASITCYFKRSGTIQGTFTTDTGTHEATTLNMTGEPETATEPGTNHSVFCPSSMKLSNMKFKLYLDGATTSGSYPPSKGATIYATNP